MFRNYLKTAFRSLLRHRFFSAINIFGLSISMTICMAIIMLVADQLTYDEYNTRRDRIYRINTIPLGDNGARMNETATSPLPLHDELMERYTGVEQAVRLARGFGNHWIELDQNVNIPVAGYFADPQVLDFFQLELAHGDPATALKEPYSVVLTQRAARKLFRQENPVGESFKVGDAGLFKVTGVLKETDHKSHIAFDALASYSTLNSLSAANKGNKDHESWYNYTTGWVYVLLSDGFTPEALQDNLSKIERNYYAKLPKPDSQQKLSFNLQSLRKITPGALINNPIGPLLPWIFVYFFAGLAGVVMLTSCFNFTNLSIARSLTRAREIGVRKVTGALRGQIFLQFISESVLVALFALLVACVLLVIARPFMLNLSFARMLQWDLASGTGVYATFVVFAVVVGVMAGLFPALVISGFEPVKVLKGFHNMKILRGVGLRKVLLTAQFTFSLVFILSVIVVFNQLQLLLHADHGFSIENKIVVPIGEGGPHALKTELLKYPNLTSVTATSHIPAAGVSYGTDFKRDLSDKDWTSLYYYAVDEDYLQNLDLEMVAGKFFTADAGASNKNFVVLNEMAVEAFHFKSPQDALGQTLILQNDSSQVEVIGVVRNYNHQMLMEQMGSLALRYYPAEFHLLQVQYSGTSTAAHAAIAKAWAAVYPGLKFEPKDFKTEVHKMYDIFFGDLVSILGVVSFLAIVISCLGLLGMATYTTETRVKEVSIRKILGSSSGSIVFLLSRGFVVILLLAIAIAVPLAWMLNNLWLQKLAYHVEVDFSTIVAGVMILIAFGAVTIGSQTWRAAMLNPVQNLKSE